MNRGGDETIYLLLYRYYDICISRYRYVSVYIGISTSFPSLGKPPRQTSFSDGDGLCLDLLRAEYEGLVSMEIPPGLIPRRRVSPA